MSFHVTQCPGCDSTFNTNARILQAAAGKVRCGACLTVFEAADNFIAVNDPDEGDDASVFVGYNPADYFNPSQFISRSALTAPETEPFEKSKPQTSELSPAQEDYNHAEEEFLIAVATELEPVEPTAPTDTPDAISASLLSEVFPEPAEPEAFPEPDELEAIPAPASPEVPRPAPEAIRIHPFFSLYPAAPPAPESQPEPELEPETETEPEAEPNPEGEPQPEQALTADDIELIDLDLFEYAEISPEDSSEIDSTPEIFALASTEHNPVSDASIYEVLTTSDDVVDLVIDQVTDEATDETIDEVTQEVTDEDADVVCEEFADDVTNAVIDEVTDDSTEAIRARAFRAMLHDDDALEALPQESRTAIGQVLPPVELLSGRERPWGRRLLLTVTCLILALTLAAQLLWQRLPIYSRTAEWRPLYEFGCRFIACELPVYSEISAIRSNNLVVRTHPTAANALTVSLSFRNTARFPQPFPVLILSFNSATNAIIALREFAPEEYLDAGLRELQLMPVMSPVQIEIDVIDPGADAVNYTVAFRRP